jgi:hypothetical protein
MSTAVTSHPFKFGRFSENHEELEHRYDDVWDVEKTTGPDRLIIGPATGHIALIGDLIHELPEPFGVLYVLLVSRRGHERGRYQRPDPASRAESLDFLHLYRDYFEQDGRHHVWLKSLPANSTIVYDNHNVIYAYGPLQRFQQVLESQGLRRGEVRFPAPHTHRYNAEFDTVEDKIMEHWMWKAFPLQDTDDE